MMWDSGAWGSGDWLLMSLTMVVFWGGLIAFGVWLIRSIGVRQNANDGVTSPKSTPDEVLAKRFARGEIDEDEFKRRRDLMRSDS
jgi:putative membrane protein